jgi:hypothetical protein
VECSFGLLNKRFNILAILGQSCSQRALGLIMCASIILHNMIIDDDRDGGYDENYHTVTSVVAPPVNYEQHLTLGLIFLNLQSDLIEHVWNNFH